MNERLQFEFHRMDPSDWTASFVEEELAPLMNFAPRNCHMKVRISRFDSGIEGKLIAHTDAGTFIVKEYSEDISALTKSLKKKMRVKLQKWRDAVYDYQHGRAG